jgi:outer membrane protein OmpA-like peptidoglycan-associated protein
LDQIAERMRAAPPDAVFQIEGHADDSGPRAFNWSLSRNRALTVRFHLMLRGIAWRRLTVVGYGFTRPVETDDKSRRVQFRMLLVPKPSAPDTSAP